MARPGLHHGERAGRGPVHLKPRAADEVAELARPRSSAAPPNRRTSHAEPDPIIDAHHLWSRPERSLDRFQRHRERQPTGVGSTVSASPDAQGRNESGDSLPSGTAGPVALGYRFEDKPALGIGDGLTFAAFPSAPRRRRGLPGIVRRTVPVTTAGHERWPDTTAAGPHEIPPKRFLSEPGGST